MSPKWRPLSYISRRFSQMKCLHESGSLFKSEPLSDTCENLRETTTFIIMKKILFFLYLLPLLLAAQPCKEVIGYYPGWQWYDRAKLVNPMTIDYSKYSILNYAFFKPNPDGTIVGTDSWADDNLLLGPFNWQTSPATHYTNQSLVGKAHAAGVKILISVGGWTLSDDFPAIAGNPTKRATFAHSCKGLVQTYDLDGIDIDWEYPGYAAHNGSLADKANYTLFLQQIRDSLTTYQAVTGKTYLLTAAVGASQANMANVEWNNVKNILDIINVMSYDFFGAWDATTNHNSPLYAPAQGDPTFNLNSAVSYLMTNYGVPANKIAAGMAFYGRSVKTTGTPNLHVASAGTVDNITFQTDDGSPQYYNILANASLFTNNWDNAAQVPYLTGNGNLKTFVSYDNKQSIGLKASYIKNNNLRGAIIWEITGDYLETSVGSGVISGTPLADTLNQVFCNVVGGGGGGAAVCTTPTNIIATQTGTNTNLSWANTGASSYNLQYKETLAATWISATSATNAFTLANLTCGTNYDIKVQGVCPTLTSAYSTTATFATNACAGGGGGGVGSIVCSSPTMFYFDSLAYIPMGEIKIGQARIHAVWGTSVDAYIPTNRMNWAIANAHAAHLFRNVAGTDKIPANFYFATSFKESFCGCDANIQAAPANSPFPFTYQASSLGDGCFQIESLSAYGELTNMYPQRFPAGQHSNLIGNQNYETAALSKAYYDIFSVKYWEVSKGWNPKDFFNNSTDPNAALKLMAVAYNRGLWYTPLGTVLSTDRTNAITSADISPYFVGNVYGYDYQNALTQYVQVLGNNTAAIAPAMTAINPATNLPYNYFDNYYNPQVTWAEVNNYIDSIAVMYPQANIATVKTAVHARFNAINGGNSISFRYDLGLVLDKLILVLPADDPTTNIAATYGCASGTITPPANIPPTVAITSPANNAHFASPATIVLQATATDADGTVSQVQFFNGATLLGTDASSPYSFSWTNVANGTYTITAKATDNTGAVTTSTAITVIVANNVAPSVSLTSPANNTSFGAPATITLQATATDTDGTVTKVQFYNGATLLGQDLTSPYSFSWANVAIGTYIITAKATDNSNAVTTSIAFIINVVANTPPTVSLTAPTNNSTFSAPATIVLQATASDANGTVTKVQFYNGATLLGQDLTAPYSFSWANVAIGTYTITAKATDNNNAITTSSAFTIHVVANTPPTVNLTSPINNATFSSLANISLSANANDVNGSISKVQFYRGATLLNTDVTAPYSYNWNNIVAGTYTFTAKATDNNGVVTTSAAVTVTVTMPAGNVLPTVSFTAPANNAIFTPAPATVILSANAADANGTVHKVLFYNGSTLLNQDYTAPYTFTWANVGTGTYTLKAYAMDNNGAMSVLSQRIITVNSGSGSSTCVSPQYVAGTNYVQNALVQNVGNQYTCNVPGWCSGSAQFYAPGTGTSWQQAWTIGSACATIVGGNAQPFVSLTSPLNHAAYTVPANPILSANAADIDGTITKVEFFNGATLLGQDLTSPYSLTLSNAVAGIYTITAKATDNLGGTATSAAITVVIGSNSTPCTRPAWLGSSTYLANDTISYAGVVYKAKWWTQNENPALSGANGAWATIGNCGSGANIRFANPVVNIPTQIFPNPVTDILHIQVEEIKDLTAEIVLYNAIGEKVAFEYKTVENGNLISYIEMNTLSKGIYTLVISTASVRIVQKVVKE